MIRHWEDFRPVPDHASGQRIANAAALARITLCCVDTNTGGRGYAALRRSLDRFPVTAAVLFAPVCPQALDSRIRWVKLPRFASVAEYSGFMLRGLRSHIETSHCLIVQWDGFVLDSGRWDDGFLDYDYIGAIWPQFLPDRQVGNGGFSLRSRRLLDALADPAMVLHHPEDLCICHTNRARLEADHAIRFAPPAIAARFAFERAAPAGPTFGFHGLFNFLRVLPVTCDDEIRGLPLSLLYNRDAADLGAALIARRHPLRYRICFRIFIATLTRRPQRILALWKLWREAAGQVE